MIDSNLPLSSDTDSEIQLLKEVPLYNDVMLPSTSDKLALPLSPLPPYEPLHVSTISSEAAKAESFPSSTFTSLRSAEVRHSIIVTHFFSTYCYYEQILI